MKYRVLLGFDISAVNVAAAETTVATLIMAAQSLDDLKTDMVGFKVVELENGSEGNKS